MSVSSRGGKGGGRDGYDLYEARSDEVRDCSSLGASERLALKKDGIEAGRTGLSVQDWRRNRGRLMDDRTTHDTKGERSTRGCEDRDSKTKAGSKGAYDRLRDMTEDKTRNRNDVTFQTHVWAKGNWKRSSGSKRRVYIPDEHRDAKRYDKNNDRKLELITYNAMYAADGARIRDISQTFPWAVVGVQGLDRGGICTSLRIRHVKRDGMQCTMSRTRSKGERREGPRQGWRSFCLTKWRHTYRQLSTPKTSDCRGEQGRYE